MPELWPEENDDEQGLALIINPGQASLIAKWASGLIEWAMEADISDSSRLSLVTDAHDLLEQLGEGVPYDA